MKIAVLSSFPPRKCGVAYLMQNLFDEWRAEGHELVTFGMAGSESDYEIDTGSLMGMMKIVSIIKREKIEHISVQFIIGLSGKKYLGLNFLLFLLALRRRRVIVTLHELHYLRSLRQVLQKPSELFHLALEVLVSSLSSGTILHTEYQVRQLRKCGIRNVRCIYLGIRPRAIPRERTVLNRALFFGKINPGKGVHLFPEIARACPDVRFMLACSYEPQFEGYRAKLEKDFAGIPNLEFVFKEWIGEEEKEGYFRAADVLVLPYLSTFYQSGVASESGVYNIPIIVPRLGPLSEIVDKYKTGVSLASVDPDEIRMAIHTVLENYPAYLAGIRKYREEADWTVASRKYVDYLRG